MTFNATSQVLSGTPAAGTGGTYTIQFTASNGLSPDAGQSFTLMVREAPVINSANQVTFVAGTATSFTLTATGFPAATLSKTGNLPNGLTFNASTGMLSGTPAPNATGIYHVQFKANNGVSPTAVQAFTLTVSR
jgi:hypothetical protein